MDRFEVRSAPYLHAFDSTRTIMLDVCLALTPALIWGVYVFGWRALVLTLVSCASALAFELLFQFALRRKRTVTDGTALVTGLLLAFQLPATAPLWLPVLGAALAMVVFKGLFGGVGKNFLNPAVAARGVLTLAFFGTMNRFAPPFSSLPLFGSTAGAAEAVTAEAALRSGAFPESLSLYDLVSGTQAGAIGQVSALLLLAGGLYLLAKRVISWHIPLSFLGSFFLLCFFFPSFGEGWQFALWQLLSGATVLSALFLATDPTTTPITDTGRLLFGLGCGAITFLFRKLALPVEGAMVAIFVMNLLSPLLDLLRMLPRKIRARNR